MDSLTVTDFITVGHEIFLFISKLSYSSYLSWVIQLNVGSFNADLLVLVLMLAAVVDPLLYSGPSDCDISMTTAFVTSIAGYMIAWVTACVFSILPF